MYGTETLKSEVTVGKIQGRLSEIFVGTNLELRTSFELFHLNKRESKSFFSLFEYWYLLNCGFQCAYPYLMNNDQHIPSTETQKWLSYLGGF